MATRPAEKCNGTEVGKVSSKLGLTLVPKRSTVIKAVLPNIKSDARIYKLYRLCSYIKQKKLPKNPPIKARESLVLSFMSICIVKITG